MCEWCGEKFSSLDWSGLKGQIVILQCQSQDSEGKGHRGNLCCGPSTAAELTTPNLLVFYELYKDVSLCSLHLQTRLQDGMYSQLQLFPAKMMNVPAFIRCLQLIIFRTMDAFTGGWPGPGKRPLAIKEIKQGDHILELLKPSSWSYQKVFSSVKQTRLRGS